MRARTPWMVVLLAGLLSGCNTTADNPFASITRTVVPPEGTQILFATDAWSATPAAREIYAVDVAGTKPTRLTFCNDTGGCDLVEPVPAPQRERMFVRQQEHLPATATTAAQDASALVFMDLSRGVTSEIIKATAAVQSADWSVTGGLITYSARGGDGLEDIFVMQPQGTQNQNVTVNTESAPVRERHPRFDAGLRFIVYERNPGDGHSTINVLGTGALTTGGTFGALLPDGSYAVGADADPTFSPDATHVVFRRMTAVGNGRGYWDIMTVGSDKVPQVVVSGPAYRGAPDWGDAGITFSEIDPDTGQVRLVVVQPDGTGRTVPVTLGAGFSILNPRWLRQ